MLYSICTGKLQMKARMYLHKAMNSSLRDTPSQSLFHTVSHLSSFAMNKKAFYKIKQKKWGWNDRWLYKRHRQSLINIQGSVRETQEPLIWIIVAKVHIWALTTAGSTQLLQRERVVTHWQKPDTYSVPSGGKDAIGTAGDPAGAGLSVRSSHRQRSTGHGTNHRTRGRPTARPLRTHLHNDNIGISVWGRQREQASEWDERGHLQLAGCSPNRLISWSWVNFTKASYCSGTTRDNSVTHKHTHAQEIASGIRHGWKCELCMFQSRSESLNNTFMPNVCFDLMLMNYDNICVMVFIF